MFSCQADARPHHLRTERHCVIMEYTGAIRQYCAVALNILWAVEHLLIANLMDLRTGWATALRMEVTQVP